MANQGHLHHVLFRGLMQIISQLIQTLFLVVISPTFLLGWVPIRIGSRHLLFSVLTMKTEASQRMIVLWDGQNVNLTV